jgi:predicted O-methyltransferase YrrM
VVGYGQMSDQQDQELWSAVDQYIGDHLVKRDEALEGALAASTAANLPAIAVSPAQGKLLHLLARAQGARDILEIGTLGGYSTIWLARAMPADGRLVTLEMDPKHATVARANISRAGLAEKVDLRLGPAIDTLPRLVEDRRRPFDLVFIDADKPRIPEYFTWAVRLGRPGTLIIVDNVVRKGAVADPHTSDRNAQGVRLLYERLASEPRVTATAIQTVGSKGYDGFILARINDG